MNVSRAGSRQQKVNANDSDSSNISNNDPQRVCRRMDHMYNYRRYKQGGDSSNVRCMQAVSVRPALP